MPVDPSIFGGRPQMRSVEDFDRQAVDLANQRVLGDMGRLNLLAKQREFAAQDQAASQANALAALQRQMAGASDPELAKAYRGRGYFGEAQALEGKMLGQQETQSKIAKTAQGIEADKYKLAFDRINATRDIVSKAGGKEQLKQLLADAASGDNPVLDVQTVQAMYLDAPDDPAQWGAFQSDALMKTADAKTRIAQISPDANARLQAETAAANRERMAADAAAGRAVQVRGQDIGSARARENLAFQMEKDERDRTQPKPKPAGPMSVTLQKELIESDDAVQANSSVKATLESALKLNDKAYSGYGAKTRAVARSNVPFESEAANATIDLDNMMTGQALESLKAVFGGMPTEGERKILLDMQASVDKTPAQRKSIIDRAITAADRRAKMASAKAKAIRSGTYLTEGAEMPVPGGDTAVDAALKKYGM